MKEQIPASYPFPAGFQSSALSFSNLGWWQIIAHVGPKTRYVVVVHVVVLLTVAATSVALALPLPAPITLAGVGGVAPGMTVEQVHRTWRVPVAPKGSGACKMARISSGPVRAYALFQRGVLGAVFFTAGVRTDRGIGIGSTLDELEKAYGKSVNFWPARNSRTAFHIYTKPRYLGDARAIRFDIDPAGTGRVTQVGLGGPMLALTTGRC